MGCLPMCAGCSMVQTAAASWWWLVQGPSRHQLLLAAVLLQVPVHALGRCDNNKPWPPGRLHKIDVMRK